MFSPGSWLLDLHGSFNCYGVSFLLSVHIQRQRQLSRKREAWEHGRVLCLHGSEGLGAEQVRGPETTVFVVVEASSSAFYSPKSVSSVPDSTV